jgi:hypothetical protein
VQDGLDPGHIDSGSSTLSITNSAFYGNGGGQLKWGYNFASATITVWAFWHFWPFLHHLESVTLQVPLETREIDPVSGYHLE